MSVMIEALKNAKLISQKKADWGDRQLQQIDKIAQKLVRSDVDPEEAKKMAKIVNDSDIKKREQKRIEEWKKKRRSKPA